MARKKMKSRLILMIVGLGIFLSATIAALSTEDETVKIAFTAAALSVLFASLIYCQLKFYREGDSRHIRNHVEVVTAHTPPAPGHIRSPHHRAIWKNMDQARGLMQLKEREFSLAQMKKEKQSIGLPQEEEIVFMVDRFNFYFGPVALISLVFFIIAASPSKEFSTAFSFACLCCGLLGLLVLTTARFSNRYYLTNFRVLTREKWPLKKEQWSAIDYREISAISRRKRLLSEQLTLKSVDGSVKIGVLSKHKLQTMLGILHQNRKDLEDLEEI